MTSIRGSLLALLASLSIATTFVIQENGVEVGRWEEADGKDTIEIIDNAAPKPTPKPLGEPVPLDTDVGYQWSDPKKPDGEVKQWKVSGRVLDIVRLKGIKADEIIFRGAGEIVKTSSNFEGFFNVKLPAFEKSGYTIEVKAPGYVNMARVRTKSSFKSESYRERLLAAQAMGSFHAIRGTLFDIEVGLYPQALTEKEQQDLARFHRERATGRVISKS